MVKKGRKRIINIPKAEDLGKIKEIEQIEKDNQKKIIEEKYKLDQELQKQKDIENEKLRIQEENNKKEEKKLKLQNEIKLKKEELNETIIPVPEGYDKREIYKDQDEHSEGIIVKYESDKPDEFIYKTQASEFQQNLKEFFKDIPPEEEEYIQGKNEENNIDEILLADKTDKDKADTVNEFNNQVKELMTYRNKNATPHAYLSSKKEEINHENDKLDKKFNILHNTVIKNKNTKVSTRRGTLPVSRVNNKISENRMI